MEQIAKFGPNLTGASAAPDRAREMLQGRAQFIPPASEELPDLSADVIAQASEGEPLGHTPLAPSVSEEDEQMALFLDKLGERFAFERTGVRLYEGVLAKLQAYGSYEGGPQEEDLERIREQELVHFQALAECIIQCGGDPTAMTPSADVAGQLAN